MEKNACCESDTRTLKTVERKMSSKLCLLESDLGKTSCEVEEIVSKVMAGSNVTCDDVVKEEYEICDTNGFSSTVLCAEEIDKWVPLEYVKVELTDENSEADVQKVATRQEEFNCKNIKSRTIENKSKSVTSDEKATNNANQGCSESIENSTRSEVKEEKISILEKQKFTKSKGHSDSR
jgi:hypothetical protein